MYKSQVGQDKWVIELLNNKKNGYFLDIGAYNGVDISNTYILEKNFNWDGLCIEADPDIFKELIKYRNVKCINYAITNIDGYVNFTSNNVLGSITKTGKEIPAKTLKTVLKEYNVPKIIDYISLDIEGSESLALEEFPFNDYKFKIMTVEHNLYLGDPTNKNKINKILIENGYSLYKENVTNVGNDPFEDWFINKNLL
jgi:FkbM family methyltransferase